MSEMLPRRVRNDRALAAVIALPILLIACGGGSDSPTGAPALSNACGAPPYFTVLPISPSRLAGIALFGGVDAPGHVLPTPHSGIFATGGTLPFLSPGEVKVTEVRRVRSLNSPEEPADYAIFFPNRRHCFFSGRTPR
jgi:hypothetical protein